MSEKNTIIAENLAARVEGSKLVLEIDLDATGSPSASGKSLVLSSTRGNLALPFGEARGAVLGLNLYRKRGA